MLQSGEKKDMAEAKQLYLKKGTNVESATTFADLICVYFIYFYKQTDCTKRLYEKKSTRFISGTIVSIIILCNNRENF